MTKQKMIRTFFHITFAVVDSQGVPINTVLLEPKIPRPPNAFMLYANENRKSVAQLHPTESNKDISKRLGSSWKALQTPEKLKYYERAKAVDLEHKKKYPSKFLGKFKYSRAFFNNATFLPAFSQLWLNCFRRL